MESLGTEDKISDIAADLVSCERNSLFLKHLFSNEAGRWSDLEFVCNGLNEIEDQLKQLRKLFDGRILVAWLDYPSPYREDDYCLIIFFVEELFCNNVALYNKKQFFSSFPK